MTCAKPLQHINAISGGIDRGQGTAGRLVRDDTLIDEVENVAGGVNDLVGPLTRLQTIVILRTEYNFIASSLRTYVGLRLQPRSDTYLEFGLTDDPRGLTTRTSTVYTSTNPNDPHSWRETQETTTSGFRFTLLLARRIGPFTPRFGIIESTGGLGLDVDIPVFHPDQLELQADLFDFAADTYPRLRVTMAFEFLRHAWLLGGIDDILNGPRTDYFLGAMLRFNDEDLKSILFFAGGLLAGATR